MANIDLPAGVVKDEGALFGDRGNGFSYGWRCAVGVGSCEGGERCSTGGHFKASAEATTASCGTKKCHVVKPTYRTTYLSSLHSMAACPDGAANAWEIALPPGLYKVTAGFGGWGLLRSGRLTGCAVENVLMARWRISALML